MSPGWMPTWPRRAPPQRRLIVRRRRVRRHDASTRVQREVQFGSAELPMAAVHSASGTFHRWADARLAWLRPRALPAFVAMVALIALVAVTHYLPNLAAPADAVVSR